MRVSATSAIAHYLRNALRTAQPQNDPVTVMSGVDIQALHLVIFTDIRLTFRTARTQARPVMLNWQLAQRRKYIQCTGQQFRLYLITDVFIKPAVFKRAATDNTSVPAWNQVTVLCQQNVLQ